MKMYIGNMGRWITWWSQVEYNREAVSFGDRRISYGELHENINRVANVLREQYQIKKGDRVCCLLNNCIEYYEIFFACTKIGARFVPVNIRLTGSEIEYITNDCTPKMIFTEDFFMPVLDSVKESIADIKCVNIGESEYNDKLEQAKTNEPDDQACWDDDYAILYTSGTTGFPKGAVITQMSTLTVTHNIMAAMDLSQLDRYLIQLPLCFTGALIPFSMPMFHCGGTIVLENEFDPTRTIELMEKERITVTAGVPTMFKVLSDEPKFEGADLSSVRYISAGGAPVPVSLIKTYQEKGIPFTTGYGLTEGGGFNMYLPPKMSEVKRGGYIPMMWNEIEVVNEEGKPIAPGGEIGEIKIKGSVNMKEYWNRPEATAEALKDGWLYTADLASVDEDGFYFIVDRAKDMIVTGGLNTYPAEIENIIFTHPDVAQAAVIGVADEKWGEVVTAVVAPKPGMIIIEEELIKFCREKLADYKTPKKVIFVDELPMTSSGKILKRQLREQYSSRKEHFDTDL